MNEKLLNPYSYNPPLPVVEYASAIRALEEASYPERGEWTRNPPLAVNNNHLCSKCGKDESLSIDGDAYDFIGDARDSVENEKIVLSRWDRIKFPIIVIGITALILAAVFLSVFGTNWMAAAGQR
jgi:hypothetical protein